MQTVPVTINIVKVPASSRTYENYNGVAAKVLGSLQIILGVASIVFNICAIVFDNEISYAAHGIWLPVLWFIGGAFGIASASRKTKCYIVTTMVMSILSASFLTIYVIMAPLQFLTTDIDCDYNYDYIPDGCGCYDQYDDFTGDMQTICVDCISPRDCNEIEQHISVGLLIGTAILEAIVAIVTAALCCRAMCCCRQQTTSVQQGGNQYVVVNTEGGSHSVAIPAGYQVVNTGTPAAGTQEKEAQSSNNEASAPPPYTVSTNY